jgi:hypothetical protein
VTLSRTSSDNPLTAYRYKAVTLGIAKDILKVGSNESVNAESSQALMIDKENTLGTLKNVP